MKVQTENKYLIEFYKNTCPEKLLRNGFSNHFGVSIESMRKVYNKPLNVKTLCGKDYFDFCHHKCFYKLFDEDALDIYGHSDDFTEEENYEIDKNIHEKFDKWMENFSEEYRLNLYQFGMSYLITEENFEDNPLLIWLVDIDEELYCELRKYNDHIYFGISRQ